MAVKRLSQIAASLDTEARRECSTILDSPIAWELLRFYQRNPFSIHTQRGLANIIGRHEDHVRQGAQTLVALKILKEIPQEAMPAIFAFEPSDRDRKLIEKLVTVANCGSDALAEFRKLIAQGTVAR